MSETEAAPVSVTLTASVSGPVPAGVVAHSKATGVMEVDRATEVTGLIAELSWLDAEHLLDRLAQAAASVTGASCAGFVEIDPLQDRAWPIRVHVPPGDPQRVRSWLAEAGALKLLATATGLVRLDTDPEFGEPGFLAAPVPLTTHAQAYLWVAGRQFDDIDEHLLGRFATAAGRALEGAKGLEAAVRLLRGVQAFHRTGAGACP